MQLAQRAREQPIESQFLGEAIESQPLQQAQGRQGPAGAPHRWRDMEEQKALKEWHLRGERIALRHADPEELDNSSVLHS
jgi:hypothetical protein